MEKCSVDAMQYIFTFFHKYSLPYYRLVCKRWANIIKERRCLPTKIVEDAFSVSLELINDLEKYVPIKSEKYFRAVAFKDFYDDKIPVLSYLYIKQPLFRFNLGKVSDVKTLQWLTQQKFVMALHLTLYSYSLELLEFHQHQSRSVEIAPYIVIPKKDLSKINISNQTRADTLARHDLLHKLKNIINDHPLDIKKILCAAVHGKAKECIQYLLTFKGLNIRTFHYWLVAHDESFVDFLLTLKQSPLIEGLYMSGLSLPIIQKLFRRHGTAWFSDLRHLKWIIFYNRIDVAKWLEWQGLEFPSTTLRVFAKELKRPLRLSVETLDFCHQRKFIFYTKVLENLYRHCNDDTLDWFLKHEYKIYPVAYLGLLENGSLESIRKLNVSLPDKHQIEKAIKKRGSSIDFSFLYNHIL